MLTGLHIFFLAAWMGNPSTVEVKDGAIRLGFEGPRQSDGIPTPWRMKATKGRTNAQLSPNDADAQQSVLCMQCEKACYTLDYEFEADAKKFRVLSWSWKALQTPARGDVRAKDTDDQALQVLIGFKGKKSISYIWDTTAPVGTVTTARIPFVVELKVLVIESGTENLGQWLPVRRNLYDDYKMLFGEEPTEIMGVRIQINCQHTGNNASGCIGPLTLSPTTPP